MKFLKIIFTVILAMILFILISVYPYANNFTKTINNTDNLTNLVISSDLNKKIKEVIDKEINIFLEELEKEVTNSIKDSLTKSTNGKVNIDTLMKTKEVQDSIQQITDEVGNVIGQFNTEENINIVLSNIVLVLHDNEEIKIDEVIDETIDAIIQKDNINIEEETEDILKEFTSELANSLYEAIKTGSDINLTLNDDNSAIINPIPTYLKIINKYTNYLLIAIIVLAILILLINIKTIHYGIRAISISLLISGILIIITSFVFKSIDLESLIGTSELANFVTKLLLDFISNVNMMGIIYFIIGIIGIIVSIIISKIKKRLKEAK